MFKKKLLTIAMVTMGVTAFAQTVGVNSDGNPADPSALLDVRSTDKGMLIPRMNMAARNAIASPATGLLIFQTDNTAGFYYNSGTPGTPAWTMIAGAGDLQGTQNGVLIGQGVGTPGTYSAASTAANQVLATPVSGGAPTWVDANTTLTTSDATGTGPVVVTNGAGQMVGTGNATIDVQGTIGGVMYGLGSGVSATFTGASTGANQVLSTPTMGGAPIWADPNSLLTTGNIAPGTGSSVVVTNGTAKVLGATAVTMDVQGTQGGVMYGTGAGTAATFTPAGTTGQYLRSSGTGAPAFTTPKARFSIPANHTSGATALAVGQGSLSGGVVNITNVPSLVGMSNYFLILGACYQATSTVEVMGATGWIYAATAGGTTLNVTLYKVSGIFNGACSATFPTGALSAAGNITSLGSCSVNILSTDGCGKYLIDLSGSPVTLNAGEALVLHMVNNSIAARAWYSTGTVDLRANVQ